MTELSDIDMSIVLGGTQCNSIHLSTITSALSEEKNCEKKNCF